MRERPEKTDRLEPEAISNEKDLLISSIVRLLYQADLRKLNNIYQLVIQII